MEETKPEKPKGLIGKLKDIGEEKEHQLEVLGTLVRLGVVVWSAPACRSRTEPWPRSR